MKKITSIILSVMMITTLVGCGNSEKKSEAVSVAKETTSKSEKTTSTASQTLNIGLMPDVDAIPYIIAEKMGYFEKEGLKVNIQHFKSAQDRDSALQSGKLDGMSSDVLAVAFANEGGFDLKIVAKSQGAFKLVVGKNSQINSIKDLRGKSVAISKNTIIEYSIDKILESSGLKGNDIKKMVIPQIPTRLEMLENGKVDAALLPDPLATLAVTKGAKLLSNASDIGIYPGVMVFTNKAIEEKTKEMGAFFKAYNAAVEYLQKEPAASYMDIVIKEASFPPTVKDSIILPKFTKTTMPEEKDITEVIQWLKDKELIKKDYKYMDITTDKFVR